MCDTKVSIIVPIYNAESFLLRCVGSIQGQTFQNFELILIDDCSSDKSGSICRELARQDTRIRVYSQHRKRGAGAARNLGMLLAEGRYIAFIDADDAVAPRYLEVLISVAEKEAADIVQMGFCMTDGRGKRKFQWASTPRMLGTSLKDRMECLEPPRIHIAPWGKLIRQSFLQESGILFAEAPIANDLLFHVLCVMLAKRYAVIPDVLYTYWLNGSSLQHTSFPYCTTRYIDSFRISVEAMADYFALGYAQENKREVRRLITGYICRHYLAVLRNHQNMYGKENVRSVMEQYLLDRCTEGEDIYVLMETMLDGMPLPTL